MQVIDDKEEEIETKVQNKEAHELMSEEESSDD